MKKSLHLLSENPNQTKKIGKKLASLLGGGEIIGLLGDLGGGKTTFISGVASGLGIKESVLSPTFVLLKEYKIPKNVKCPRRSRFATLRGKQISKLKSQATRLCHFDFWRLKDEKEASELGLEEYLGKPNLVCVIEWADKIAKILPKERLTVEFKYIGENEREINFKPIGERYQILIKNLTNKQ